jgi:hypothetical protein
LEVRCTLPAKVKGSFVVINSVAQPLVIQNSIGAGGGGLPYSKLVGFLQRYDDQLIRLREASLFISELGIHPIGCSTNCSLQGLNMFN